MGTLVIFVFYSYTIVDFLFVIHDKGESALLLLSANSANFQLCHEENKLILNEMVMRSVTFDQHA